METFKDLHNKKIRFFVKIVEDVGKYLVETKMWEIFSRNNE